MVTETSRDKQTVTPEGEGVQRLPEGVTLCDAVTHVDARGTLTELFDPRWGMHEEHEDRYFILLGEMEVIFYDNRPDSPTYGEASSVVLSEYRRRLMNIPTHIWHANRNIGSRDVIVVNLPTRPYDHASPDKYRLPLDTDEIPYQFEDPRGW